MPEPSPQPSPLTAGLAALGGGKRRRARIEIIPLIDVIFFLLATFVLFTLSLNQSGGLRVALPTAATGEPRDAHGTLTLTVTADGSIAWNRQPVSTAEFSARLQALLRTEPNPRVLINGDEHARFAAARSVLDELRNAGIAQIKFETQVRPAGP